MDFDPSCCLGVASETCPRGMALQALAFNKAHWSADEARAWARRHDYPDDLDTEPSWSYYRLRIKNPKEFQFFRWGRPWKPGLSPVYGCPRAKAAKTSRRAAEERAVVGIGAFDPYEIVETYSVPDVDRASKHFALLLAAGQGYTSEMVPNDDGGVDVVAENGKAVRFVPSANKIGSLHDEYLMVKSKNHIGFDGDFEYFLGDDGSLFRASISDVLDIHGYRAGARWEAPPWQVKQRLKLLGLA